MAFDPDAFLGQFGGAPGDDERPAFLDKKSGNGFDPDAFLAKGAATETRPFKNTGPDLAGQLRVEAKAAPAEVARNASPIESDGTGFINGASFGFSDELEGAARRAQDILLRRQGKSYSQYRDESRAMDTGVKAANPIAAGAGELAGGLATAIVPVGAGARGASLGRTVATSAAQGAVGGAGNSTADLTEGDVGGLARDVGTSAATSAALTGAVGKAVRRAPERVDERLVANISRGPAGGAAKDKLYKNVVAKAGEEFEGLNETLGRNPGVKASLIRDAASKPEKSAKLVTRVIDRADGELSPIYRQIDAGPATPRALQLQNKLIELQQTLKDAGNTGMADVVEGFQGHIARHYGDGDAITDGAVLTASALRRLKGEVGEIAFKGDATSAAGFKAKAKQLIYGAINETIEDAAAQTPGVSVDRLRTLNKDASMMIAVRDALADRGAKDKAGRTSLFQVMLGSGLITGGAAAGGIEGAVAGAALGAGIKAAAPVARTVDFQLAKLVQAARNGSTPAQLGQMAVELGMSRIAAEEISRRGIGALTDGPAPQ